MMILAAGVVEVLIKHLEESAREKVSLLECFYNEVISSCERGMLHW